MTCSCETKTITYRQHGRLHNAPVSYRCAEHVKLGRLADRFVANMRRIASRLCLPAPVAACD